MKTTPETLRSLSQLVGMVLMTAAATFGMLELPDHPRAKVVVPNQPVFAYVSESSQGVNPLRREREESAPHYISYSAAQRTPGRTGKY